MTTATIYDPSDRDLTPIAKLLTEAMAVRLKAGEIVRAERLSICRDLLSAPHFREPVVSSLSERIHQNQKREIRVHG